MESFLISHSVICYFSMVIIENVITQALIQTAGVRSTKVCCGTLKCNYSQLEQVGAQQSALRQPLAFSGV